MCQFSFSRVRLHEFEWHGPDLDVIGRMIQKNARFTQLTRTPDQFYYNVSIVLGAQIRTATDPFDQLNYIIHIASSLVVCDLLVNLASNALIRCITSSLLTMS